MYKSSKTQIYDGYGARGIFRMLGALAMPAIVSNVTVPLLGLSDTFITGHLGSERYMAAIAVGTMMANALYWLCGFLRMGTTGLTAEAFGKGDAARRRDILTVALAIGAAIGVAMTVLSPLLCRLMTWLMSPPEATARLAGEYFLLSVAGAPAILCTMALSGWMVGSQNTLYPMVTAISVNIINIALSMLLVFVFHTGFIGVAVGTLAANWAGLSIAFLLALRMRSDGRLLSPLKQALRRVGLRRFFKVNGNLFVRSACLMSVSFALTGYAGQMGDTVLAVNAVLMQFFFFFSYFMDGFAFGGEALCGRFSGGGKIKELKLSIRGLAVWSGIVTLVFTLLYLFFTPAIASLLTEERSVVEGVEALQWAVCVMPAVSVGAFMFDGVYVGLTDTSRMMMATMAGAVSFFALHYLLPPVFPGSAAANGASGLWLAFLSFLLTRGLVLAGCLPAAIRRTARQGRQGL